LVDLQAIEIGLRRAKARLSKGEQTVKRQERRIAQLEAGLKAKRDEIRLTRLQSQRLELELKTKEDEIAKLRVALNTTKTNKDYSAILTRMNTDKAKKSKLEDQVLALMTQVDNDQAACREIEQEIEVQKQRLTEIQQQVAEKHKVIQKEIDELSVQHAQAMAEVPPKEQALFERLADRFEGEVLARIVETNGRRKEHSCGGCYMSIPLERVNALMTRDEVVICSSCGRILMLDWNAGGG